VESTSSAGGIGPKTREEYVADKIREAILRCELKPGESLDESTLAATLNVSRTPVRSGLRILATENLVEISPYRGALVAELSLEGLEEVYFIRCLLEGTLAKLAVPKMDPQRIASLQTLLEELEDKTDLDHWLDLNHQFHNTIYTAVHRPRLLSMIRSLRNVSAPYIRQFVTSPEHTTVTRISHHRIFEACVQRDGAAAQVETEKHLMDVLEIARGT